MKIDKESKIIVLAPLVKGRKGEHKKILESIKKDGFIRARIDGKVHDINQNINLEKNKKHTIEVVIDRLLVDDSQSDRLTESIELALKISSGTVVINELPDKDHLFSEHFACTHCEISMEELSPGCSLLILPMERVNTVMVWALIWRLILNYWCQIKLNP